MDYIHLAEKINTLSEKYGCLAVNGLGESIMGRGIPAIRLGCGEKEILYIAGQSAKDSVLSFALINFIEEYCSLLQSKSKLYGIPIEYINERLSIIVIPMLNPDGVEYCVNGVCTDNPLYERLLKMNVGNESFADWQANGRGVDLRTNYGENSESEPETGHLCNYLRFSQSIKGIIELAGEGKAINYVNNKNNERIARAIEDMTDGTRAPYSDDSPELCVWAERELTLPCFSVGCDVHKGENPFIVYTKIRKLLFSATMLF